MSTSTVNDKAAQVQSEADAMVAQWFKIVEGKSLSNVEDSDLEDRAAAIINTVRACREYAKGLSPEFRPCRALGDKIGFDNLKRTLSRLFKVSKDMTLGKVRQGYKSYLRESGQL